MTNIRVISPPDLSIKPTILGRATTNGTIWHHRASWSGLLNSDLYHTIGQHLQFSIKLCSIITYSKGRLYPITLSRARLNKLLVFPSVQWNDHKAVCNGKRCRCENTIFICRHTDWASVDPENKFSTLDLTAAFMYTAFVLCILFCYRCRFLISNKCSAFVFSQF